MKKKKKVKKTWGSSRPPNFLRCSLYRQEIESLPRTSSGVLALFSSLFRSSSSSSSSSLSSFLLLPFLYLLLLPFLLPFSSPPPPHCYSKNVHLLYFSSFFLQIQHKRWLFDFMPKVCDTDYSFNYCSTFHILRTSVNFQRKVFFPIEVTYQTYRI